MRNAQSTSSSLEMDWLQPLRILPASDIRSRKFNQIHRVIEDPEKVYKVEGQLKTIIDYGFSERVEEELLTFDQEGKLQDVQSANIDIIAHKAEMSKKQQQMAEKYNRRKKGTNQGRIIRIDDLHHHQGSLRSSEEDSEEDD